MVRSYLRYPHGALFLTIFGTLTPALAMSDGHFHVGMHKFALRDPVPQVQQPMSLEIVEQIFNPRPAVSNGFQLDELPKSETSELNSNEN